MLSYSLVLFLFSQAHLLSLAEALCMMFWAWKMTQFSAYNVVDSFYGSTRELVSLSSDRSTDVLSVFSSRAKKRWVALELSAFFARNFISRR